MNPFLTLNRIEFPVTYRCNSRCKHCQLGPSKRALRPAAIEAELAAQIVRDVATAYPVRSVMTWGGEPLLFPDVVCAIHAAARECGIASRDIISNIGWPREEVQFREIAVQLAESGVCGIYISVDAFHQEYIPLSVVERNVRSLAEAGIEKLVWNPCWVVSREHDNPWNRRTRAILDALVHLPAIEDPGNTVQPNGNAPVWLSEYMPPKSPFPAGTCGDLPYTGRLDQVTSISVEPDGRVSICDEWMIIGNAFHKNIVEILNNYDPYQIPEMKAILEGGVAGLAALARQKGVEADPEGYYSVCDMCRSIRRRLGQVG